MTFRDFFIVILPELFWSLVIASCGILFPLALVHIISGESPSDFGDFFQIANSFARLGDILLVVLPVSCLAVAGTFTFILHRGDLPWKDSSLGKIASICFVGMPMIILIFAIPILTIFLLRSKDNPLVNSDLGDVIALSLTCATCIVVLDLATTLFQRPEWKLASANLPNNHPPADDLDGE